MSKLSTADFWRPIGVRAVRNAIQVTVPVLALAAATGQLDAAGLAGVGVAAVLAAALSVVKFAAGLKAEASAPAWLQAGERAAGAAAGAVVGLVPSTLQGALTTDWRGFAVTAAGAAALSLATWALAGAGDVTE